MTDTRLVRLGLLGPAEGDTAGLGRAAEFLLASGKVSRVVYLGADGALDLAVAAWARKLVGDDPSDEASWKRAAEVAATGSPDVIDKFVTVQRARMQLKLLEALPPGGRTIEMVGDRVAVLIHDKALLDEEDILAANLLIYGKSDAPMVKKIGSRWFVSPGQIGSSGGGAAILDDEQTDIIVTVHDLGGRETIRETLLVQRATKVRIQGGA